MKAELRALHSPDVQDLRTFDPKEPEHFSVFVQAMIGPSGEDGEESFDFVVCTPSWLRDHVLRRGPLIAIHHVVMNRFSFEELFKTIQEFCGQCEGASWKDVASRLACLGQWEFDKYRD